MFCPLNRFLLEGCFHKDASEAWQYNSVVNAAQCIAVIAVYLYIFHNFVEYVMYMLHAYSSQRESSFTAYIVILSYIVDLLNLESSAS